MFRRREGLWLAVGVLGLGIQARAEWAELKPAAPDGRETYRINCGADSFNFTDGSNQWWTKDEPFTGLYRWGYVGGSPAGAATADILGTTEDSIYQTHRFGGAGGAEFRYRLEMPNGNYRVTLHFAETYWNAPGQRVFDVALEGTTVEPNLDVYARAGGKFRALSVTHDVNVEDGALDVTFPRISVDNAMISGIEVVTLAVSDDQFLEFVQKKLFWAFWNETNPLTGLVSDRIPNWNNTPGGAASIASTGYGLTVLTIADKRGWMPRDQILQRVKNTLATFAGSDYKQPGQTVFLPHLEGFFYHWVDRDTGARAWSSEVSTVDSGLFILGALQAGEYFRGIDDSVAAMADAIYRRMNWTWWQNRVPTGWDPLIGDFITMGWVPEVRSDGSFYPAPASIGGSFTKARWDAYSESVLVNLLAMGSPTHAVSTAPWTYMARPWAEQYGHSTMHLAPLFAHQYHNLYYDLRNKHDAFGDYAENLRRATLVNKNYCQTLPGNSDKLWGLTAADNPVTDDYKTDYGVPPGGAGDGTVVPTAALASLPFTPLESIAAARHIYFQYKHDIWGRYGFTDSFNVIAQGRSKDLITLDNGPIIMAFENYRSGLVWDSFMRSAAAVTGLSRAGFTSYDGKPYYFSSTVKNRNLPSYAFDGNLSTRWESEWFDPQWLAVDYTTLRTMNRVRLRWETAHGKRYQVESSNDGDIWTAASDVILSDGGEDLVSFPSRTARFFRIKGLERGGVDGNVWGYSLWECSFENEALPALSTFLGGAGTSVVTGVATDTSGNTYVTGTTSEGFPTTVGAYDTTYNGGPTDGFVVKFSSTGQLLYGTYFGGSGEDNPAALVVDGSGNVYVTGVTYSTNFPTTTGVVDRTLGGERDAFVLKLNASGKTLGYSTYLGGSQWDYGQKIALGSGGQVFVAGFTHGGFPTTTGAFQTVFGGLGDAFVVKLASGGTSLLYSTYLGGNSWDGPGGIAVDSNGNAYVAGNTHSPNFPTSSGAWDRTCSNCSTNQSTDGFVVKLNASGKNLLYGTFVGGAASPASESLDGIAVDAQGRALVVGTSNGTDFPVTANALQKTRAGDADAVIVQLKSDGTGVLYSSYLGGNGADRAWGVRVDSDGRIALAGTTASSNFPTTSRAAQAALRGGSDAFWAEVSSGGALLYATYWGGSGDENDAVSMARDSAGKTILAGGTSSTDFPVREGSYQTVFGGGEKDGFVSVFQKPALGTGMASSSLSLAEPQGYQFGEVYWFPNPAGGPMAGLHVEVGSADRVDVRLFDAAGALVREWVLEGPPVNVDDGQGPEWVFEHTVPVGDLPPGVYTALIRAKKAGQGDLQTKTKLAVVR